MAGSGELFRGTDGKWSFRVKGADGAVVATDPGPPGFDSRDEARVVLTDLLEGEYNGPISEPAAATCGQEITEDTTLEADLTCPGGPALIVTADNIVLDLGGFTVAGGSRTSAARPGILLRNVKGVTVRKGTVQGFGAGIAIVGGANNVIENITAQDNRGSVEGDFGDGITVSNSSGNRIVGNTVRRNGPFSGISLVGASTGNEVRENVIPDNNMLPGDPQAGRQAMGIRIEGPGANNNKLIGNTVTNSGADGIVVLPTCANPPANCAGPGNEDNEIVDNMSHNNGTSGNGSGIRIFSVAAPVAGIRTMLRGNSCNDNVTHGIAIDAAGAATPRPTLNRVIANDAHGNLQFDGFDGNTPACGSNVWQDNDFGRFNQACVGASAPPAPPTDPPVEPPIDPPAPPPDPPTPPIDPPMPPMPPMG